MDFNFDEFFYPTTEVNILFNERITRHYIRECDSQTDLEYQRMLVQGLRGNGNNSNKVSNEALIVDTWLYNKLCQKAEVQNGDGTFVEVPNFKEKIPPQLKRHVMAGYTRRFNEISKQQEGAEGNAGNS